MIESSTLIDINANKLLNNDLVDKNSFNSNDIEEDDDDDNSEIEITWNCYNKCIYFFTLFKMNKIFKRLLQIMLIVSTLVIIIFFPDISNTILIEDYDNELHFELWKLLLLLSIISISLEISLLIYIIIKFILSSQANMNNDNDNISNLFNLIFYFETLKFEILSFFSSLVCLITMISIFLPNIVILFNKTDNNDNNDDTNIFLTLTQCMLAICFYFLGRIITTFLTEFIR